MVAPTTSRSVKKEGVAADADIDGVKRSHSDTEDGDDLAQVAPRVKKPKVVIDISDDSN